MATSATAGNGPEPRAAKWQTEALGICALAAMAVYFIAISWRKWTDPISDLGPQLHTLWRVSEGARLYHDVTWNYGPLSPCFGALLFKIFGPGIMVVATANLLLYAAIVSLAYVAFRKAWGPLGAFAALTVFISVFSFSRLNQVANYNYATPYANESTQGIFLILVTAFVAVRWSRGPSWPLALALGLCGGIAAVLKPEFMLAGGILGLSARTLRWYQRQRMGVLEYLAMFAGLTLPTLAFVLWFSRYESLGIAFMDASKAWWLVLVDHSQVTNVQQQLFTGFNQPWLYAGLELKAAVISIVAIAAIWSAGWMANRPTHEAVKAATGFAVVLLVYYCRPQPWLSVGSSFPGVMAVIVIVLALRAWGELRRMGRVAEGTLMALALALLAGGMLARMFLNARINHLGFYQAALAGMVIAAFMVAEIPRWTGAATIGRRLAAALAAAVLGIGCLTTAMESHAALADQTVPIGSGRDRFYASVGEVDEIGPLVNWTLDYFSSTPQTAGVCVLPEGEMINYLLRRPDPLNSARSEQEIVERLRLTRPEYVVFISRDLKEVGVRQYGASGEPGFVIVQWLRENGYAVETGTGGDPMRAGERKGVLVLRKPAVAPSK